MADGKDDDKTLLSSEQDPNAGSTPRPDDFTEYQTSGTSNSTGFAKAKDLARKAQSESGRLLKKRFVLEDVLGRGGMGVVYKARDLRKVEAEDSNPYIATKVLGQGFKEHPHAFVSLQQEAVKSQKLAHPNIVTVHDFDREGDTIFMTMELLKGDPLDSLLKLEAPFSRETSLRYFDELCAGLDYAHKRGLIHSDFKPANIFVTAGGTVKILDFGIARAATLEGQKRDFDAGELGALTPAYATVEMVNGEPPSFSDDVYALACVFYQMLTGEHPYDRMSAADAKQHKLKPRRPEGLSNTEWQALSKALSLSKGKRWSTIEEFRTALRPQVRSPMVKIAAAVVLAVIAGATWIGVRQFEGGQDQQAVIDDKLEAAKECFYRQSYQCAVENARLVLSLNASHAEASELLKGAEQAWAEAEEEAKLASLLAAAQECLVAGDAACARVRAREVLELDPDEFQARQILEQVDRQDRMQGMAGILQRANSCLDREDIECAELALSEARAAGAEPAETYDMQRRMDSMADARRDAAMAMERDVAALMSEANACFRQRNYDCSAQKAAAVLALDIGNTAAIEMQQSVKLERARMIRDEETVAVFLTEADDCYQKKNYSCAIAKSESALAILPGYADAKAMKKRAVGAQNQAKKSISIQ